MTEPNAPQSAPEPSPDEPPPQPWSDEAQRISQLRRARRARRRRQLQGLNNALADIVVNDMQEERGVSSFIRVASRFVLPPLVYGGVVLVRAVTGRSGWTDRELATGLMIAVALGLALANGWARLRGEEQYPPDPKSLLNGQDELTQLSLGRRRVDPVDRSLD